MALHVTNRAEVVEVGSILGDAARELARLAAGAVVRPVLVLARYVDDRLFDGGDE